MEELLRFMVRQEASDLHIKAARPPLLRVHGKLLPLKSDPLPPEAVQQLLLSLLDERQRQQLETAFYVDLAYSLPGVSRFRATIYQQRGNLSGVFRRVPFEFPTLDEWELPDSLKDLAHLPQGLVLVTGATGSGKSSTLAALIREIVDNRPVHVVTIEDPIEFLISDGHGNVSQREIGTDTRSFSEALRNTMRQDPDVIVIGEMRDAETIQTAMTAAETGHLVLSTLHTNSAALTVDRIVSAFPEIHHRQIRTQLAAVLEGVICLKLVDRLDGSGMIAAVEIMKGSPRVRRLIMDGQLQDLQEEIERSVGFERMQSMNQSLAALVINGAVTQERAMACTITPADLDLLLRKTVGAPVPEKGAKEDDDMAVSPADFSNILRLQEVQKAYEELQERHQRDVAERDSLIVRLEAEVRGSEQTGSSVEGAFRSLTEEKDKLQRQIAFQKQEYESKVEKLQIRIRELSSPALAGGGVRR